MTINLEKYFITRTCNLCKNIDKIFLSKRELAFELFANKAIQQIECKVCKSTNDFMINFQAIELDKELLYEWCFDKKLFLMPQDEELLLADEKYIDLMLDFLDNYKILDYKKDVLIEALCVIIYDNETDEENKNLLLIERVANELIKRKELVLSANNWIADYIKQVAFPIIGLTKNGS